MGLDPRAQATTSSARGLFQFTDATWMTMVGRHGHEHGASAGLGWAADAVRSGAAAAGRVREAVLALRDDPEAASLMAGELVQDNATALGRSLGRAVTAAEVHLASFLGTGGATRFLTALAADPQAPAAAVVPRAAAANRAIFHAKDGTPRSLSAVMALVAGKIGGGNDLPVRGNGLPVVAVAAPVQAPVQALMSPGLPAQARMAYLLLAELGG